MPILSVAAMNASLDNDYGTTRGPNAADSHELALFDGDPTLGGVELNSTDCPGYVRPVILPAAWAAAVGGAKSTTDPVQFADPAGPWTRQGSWIALISGDDHTTVWDCSALNEATAVTESGGDLSLTPVVFYANTVEIPE